MQSIRLVNLEQRPQIGARELLDLMDRRTEQHSLRSRWNARVEKARSPAAENTQSIVGQLPIRYGPIQLHLASYYAARLSNSWCLQEACF